MVTRVVVGLTGATGQIYGVRALELLREEGYETHLVLSNAAKVTLRQELDADISDVTDLASVTHEHSNIGAPPASGSFQNAGMIVAPCSMKTLSNIAHGNAGDLIVRSADVALKERRPLVLLPCEKPYNRIHLENMLSATDAGAIVVPPSLSHYQAGDSVDELISRLVARSLSYLDGVTVEYDEWSGLDGG